MNRKIQILLLTIFIALFSMGLKYGREYINDEDFYDSGFFKSYVNFYKVDGFEYALYPSAVPLGKYKNCIIFDFTNKSESGIGSYITGSGRSYTQTKIVDTPAGKIRELVDREGYPSLPDALKARLSGIYPNIKREHQGKRGVAVSELKKRGFDLAIVGQISRIEAPETISGESFKETILQGMKTPWKVLIEIKFIDVKTGDIVLGIAHKTSDKNFIEAVRENIDDIVKFVMSHK